MISYLTGTCQPHVRGSCNLFCQGLDVKWPVINNRKRALSFHELIVMCERKRAIARLSAVTGTLELL